MPPFCHPILKNFAKKSIKIVDFKLYLTFVAVSIAYQERLRELAR
jgi:hypothetical protein